MDAKLEPPFRRSPGRPGFWLLRPFGDLPLVLEFSDAARQRYLARVRRWRLAGLLIGAPLTGLVWWAAGEALALGGAALLCVALLARTLRDGRRVPAAAWPDEPEAPASLAWAGRIFLVFGVALVAVGAIGVVMQILDGGRWDILLVPVGLLTLLAIQLRRSIRKLRAARLRKRP